MAKKQTKSPTLELLAIVWSAPRTSWERLNGAMRGALKIAVGCGLRMDAADFGVMQEEYRSSYWAGPDWEWLYALAISAENAAAIDAFEVSSGRTAIIADNVGLGRHHSGGDRVRERLAVGYSFEFRGERPIVTSFCGDGKSFVACTYKDRDERKIAKRLTLTRDDIIAERAERKERQKLLDALTKLAKEKGNATEITTALGIKSNADYGRLPIAKIRKVAAKFEVAA